ncbi:2-keto-4-pentenoate hydratase [Pseudonocardia sp. RS010]|uniref:2-keto-4-pentenoate hydratase n=1 Tax=Pseudonocardia sp. RS010 TaxID=3385979 RepID=UPI0039A39F3E
MTTTSTRLCRYTVDAYADVVGGPGPTTPTGRARPLPAELATLSQAEAYAIRRECVTELCTTRGARPRGYKISVTGKADQERIGATEPTFGRLTDRHLLPTGAEIRLDLANQPPLEPELVLRTSADLGPEASPDEIHEAVEIAAALEIPVCRFADWWPEGQLSRLTLTGLIADTSVAGFVVVGTQWSRLTRERVRQVTAAVDTPAGKVVHGHPSAELGDPLATLAWLVGALARTGETLPAGSVVSSGALAAPTRAVPGTYRARFDQGLGEVAVTFGEGVGSSWISS